MCMHILMYVYTHIAMYIHTCMYACIHVYVIVVSACVHVFMCSYISQYGYV